MNILTKKNIFWFVIICMVLVNFMIAVRNINEMNKRKKTRIITNTKPNQINNILSPDIIAKTIDDKKIVLSQLKEKLIILRFSNFYYEDLPYLLFLDYVSKKYSNRGVKVILINTLGKHDYESVNKLIRLTCPIIKDDGSISFIFNANAYDTIIINEDRKIIFRYYRADNRMIFNQINRIFGNNNQFRKYPKEQLENDIENISFLNIRDNNIALLKNIIKDKAAIINLSISSCPGCPESYRLKTLKKLSEYYNNDSMVLVCLFGDGNSIEMLKEYAEKMNLQSSNIILGIIKRDDRLTDEEYCRLFQFNVDPRLLIFKNKGKIVFMENEGEEPKINSDYIIKKLQ